MTINELREKTRNCQVIYILLIYFLIAKRYMHLIYNNILYKENPIVGITVFLFGLFLALNLIVSKVTKSDIILLIFGGLTFILCKEQLLLIYIIMAISAKNIDNDKIIKYYIGFNLLFLLIVVIGNTIGIIPDTTDLHYRIINGVQKIRHDFGFGNPNAMFFYLMPIYTGYIYIRYEKYNWIDRILLWSVAIFVCVTTYSRTGFAVIMLGLIMVEIFKQIDILKINFIKILFTNIPLILILVSLFIGFVFATSPKLNSLLSARPEYWNKYLSGMSIFGSSKSSSMFYTYPLDNSYVYLLSLYGILVTIFFVLITNFSLNKFIEQKDYKFVIIATMFFLYGFGEDILFSTSLNFTLILMLKNIDLQDVYRFYKCKLNFIN